MSFRGILRRSFAVLIHNTGNEFYVQLFFMDDKYRSHEDVRHVLSVFKCKEEALRRYNFYVRSIKRNKPVKHPFSEPFFSSTDYYIAELKQD